MLIGRDDRGSPVRHEYYRLATSEREFWQLAAEPSKAAEQHGERLLDFFVRCLRRKLTRQDFRFSGIHGALTYGIIG